ncbi:MAG: CRISPR-associated protein Cas5 [Actinobacteria bacterium]|nr:CRISPR-associated protein Cas5 [Actinomycetota bacterium]
MGVLVFDVRSDIAHFRRPDTLGTHASYPFITRTALHGLVASILGLEALPEMPLCGVRLLSQVKSIAHELSFLGKGWVGGGHDFNRPTAIELIVKPHYRIYYHGPLEGELAELIREKRSYYHTYLGSAYCLTIPEYQAQYEDSEATIFDPTDQFITCSTVLPVNAVRELHTQEAREYARVGGMLYEHLGNRRFRGSINLIYEVHGQPIVFAPALSFDTAQWQFRCIPDEGLVCLW